MGYLDQPYLGLHNEPYPELRPAPNRGWGQGLLDSLTPDVNTWRGIVGLLSNQSLRQRPPDVSTGEALKAVADATPIGPLIDAATQADELRRSQEGGDSYGTGKSIGDLAKIVAMAFVPGGKRTKVPIFETKAPGSKGGYISDLSKTVYPTSVDDMTFDRRPNAPMVPPKVISPVELQGGLLMPAIGDRTMAGHSLTGINGQPLAFPVDLQGGPNFMRGPQQVADNAFWASNPSPNSTMANKAQAQLDTGKPVNLVYTTMGSRSGDFSHMMSDTLLAQIPNAPITKTAKREFDVAMRKVNKAWPGLDAPNLRDVLAKEAGLGKDMIEKMALGEWRDRGFPDIASSRAAITEPELLRLPGSGASGYTIANVTDPKVIDKPTVPHATYPSQIGGGEYVGGFEKPVPRSLLWPDAYAQMAKEGKKPTELDYTFTRRLPVQEATQKWLDGVMKYLNRK